MLNTASEKALSNLLMVGSAFVTIFVAWGTVTDPVNVTKLLALGAVAGAGVAIAISFGAKRIWAEHKSVLVALIIFLGTVLNSVVQSSAPITQLIYGAYGRNSGLVTYLLLTLLFVATLRLSNKLSFLKISYGLLAAGLINCIYSLWVVTIGDFIGWTNPIFPLLLL